MPRKCHVGLLLACGLANPWAAAGRHVSQPGGAVAMAMEGGGFRALTSDAGFLAGLLAFVGNTTQVSSPTFSNTGLLKRFDIFSTVSGSSWFFASLAYSSRFQTLLESMAASPGTSAAQFNAKWMTPWLRATQVDPTNFDPLRELAMSIVTKLLGKADEDTLFTLQYFLATNNTWNAFTEVLLNATASIDKDMPLAAEVDEWCHGKVWFADHSLLLPTGGKEARFAQADNLLGFPRASYSAHSSSSIPLYVPARFSMTLGMGRNSSAPFPYMAPTAVPSLEYLNYQGVVIPIVDQFTARSSPLDPSDLAGGVLVRNTGMLPISSVASASSACAGSAAIFGYLADEIQAIAHSDFTPWVSLAPDGASFEVAADLVGRLKMGRDVDRHTMRALASSAVHGVIDGGYTDGTGIAQAVAAGATEVLAILNNNSTRSSYNMELLCKDGPKPDEPDTPQELYPVFETQASIVRRQYDNFHQLQVAEDSQFLSELSVGTLEVTTADNRYFGITGGRTVTIHVVNLASRLGIGFFQNFVNYNALAQEVAQTVVAPANAEFVRSTLLPMVMGSAMQIQKADGPVVV